jgi:hypothetical protein
MEERPDNDSLESRQNSIQCRTRDVPTSKSVVLAPVIQPSSIPYRSQAAAVADNHTVVHPRDLHSFLRSEPET